MEWRKERFLMTDRQPDDAVESTYRLLQTTYWSHKRPREVVKKIIDNSLCFYVLAEERHIGFGRVISDFTTTSWIADVVLASDYQNIGLGAWMMECVMKHSQLCHTQFVLQTGTAHQFYQRLGFENNEALMSTPVDYLG